MARARPHADYFPYGGPGGEARGNPDVFPGEGRGNKKGEAMWPPLVVRALNA